MFSHTTIRHSYDFSQQMVEMAVEAQQPPTDDAARDASRREQVDRQETGLVKVLKNIRETFYRS